MDNPDIPHMSLKKLLVFILIIILPALFATDIYVPSLPHIATYFHTTETMVKLTITFYFLGFAVVQLVYGPLSDVYGRKIILLIGLGIGLIGSVLCFTADSVVMLCLARLIQGIGVGACVTIIRCLIVDVVKEDELAKAISYFTFIYGLLPAIAPIVGAYIQHHFYWQVIFIILSIYIGLLIIVVVLGLPETNQFRAAYRLNLKVMASNYKQLLSHKIFLGNTIAASVAMSGIFVFYVLSSFLLQNVLGLSVLQFGWLLGGISVGMIVGSLINIYVLRYCTATVAVTIGSAIMLITSAVMLMLSLLHFFNVWVIVLPVVFYAIAIRLVTGNAGADAFKRFKHMTGSTVALFGFIQMGSIFMATWIAAHLHTRDQIPLAALLTALSFIGVMTYHWRHGRRLLY